MDILEIRPTRLKLRHRPIKLWLWGACFMGLGATTLLNALGLMTASAQLRCDRPLPNQIRCTLQRKSLFGFSHTQTIENPYSAFTKGSLAYRGGTRYRVILSTPTGEQSLLTQTTDDSAQVNQATSQLNDFFLYVRPTVSVSMTSYGSLILLTILGLVIVSASIPLAIAPVTHLSFYKGVIRKVVIERQGLVRRPTVEYPLEAIAGVDIEERWQRYSKVYRVTLITTVAGVVPVHPEYVSRHNAEAIAYSIQRFLGS